MYRKRTALGDSLPQSHKNTFTCPKRKNGFQTIGSCFFFYVDFTIHNVMEGIPSYGRHIVNVFNTIIQNVAPANFDLKDGLNSLWLLIQRVIHVQNPATPKLVTNPKHDEPEAQQLPNFPKRRARRRQAVIFTIFFLSDSSIYWYFLFINKFWLLATICIVQSNCLRRTETWWMSKLVHSI